MTNILNREVITSITVGETKLTCLVHDKKNLRLFVGNNIGQIFIYSVLTV